MAKVQVFDLSDVAKILGMSLSRVKNWTIGRPLDIKPSIRAAQGAGTSNLYGPEELFLMGVANHLANDGLGLDVVREAVEILRKRPNAKWLLIYRPIKGAAVREQTVISATDEKSPKDEHVSIYTCNLEKLRAQIKESLASFFFLAPYKET